MPDFQLVRETFLGKYCQEFNGTNLEEILDCGIVSLAVPRGGDTALGQAVRNAWSLDLPQPGCSATTADGSCTILWLSNEQFLVILKDHRVDPEGYAQSLLGNIAYCTDQTDNWCILRLQGSLADASLERICPIDLHIGIFPVGSVARTVMEHMGAIVVRESSSGYLLISASSSARDFLHAVVQSVEHVCP